MSKRSKSLPPAAMSIEESEKLFELLKGLSPREQATLRPVLERDLEFQRREKARIQYLKAVVNKSEMKPMTRRVGMMHNESSESSKSTQSLNEISLSSEAAPQSPSGRVCYHCRCQLGLIFNAGTRCAKCRRLLCDNCRRETARSKWLCKDCYVQRELRAASGEWVSGGGSIDISSMLLEQMHRAIVDKRQENKQYATERGNSSGSVKNTTPTSPLKAINSERQFKTPPVINDENLLHPIDFRPTLERQSANSSVESPVNVEQRFPRNGILESSSNSQRLEMLSSRTPNVSSSMPNSSMWLEKPQMNIRKTVTKPGGPSPSLSSSALRPATSDVRTISSNASSNNNNNNFRRPASVAHAALDEPRSRTPGGVTGSVAKVDHLDVIAGDSRRSSAVSIGTRSTSHDTRLRKNSRTTPSSSHESLSFTSFTDASNDFREKSSVALQASCAISYVGEIQLSISYDVATASLSVHIFQCRSLPHFGSHKPNPYVKVLLVPYQGSSQVLRNKTNARKSDINPIFDQVLQFPRITKSEVDKYRMQVSVWHKDLISQNSPIGEVTITLRDYDWSLTNPLWYPLEAKTVGSANESMSMEDDESQCSRSTDVLSMGSGTSDRSVIVTGTRHPLLRNSSTSSSTSSRNSRGVRKAVFQRKTDSSTEEREHTTGTSRMSMELEHDVRKTESKRPPLKKPEAEDQTADWTIWI